MRPIELLALVTSRLTRTLNEDECRHYLHRDDCSNTPSSKLIAAKGLASAGRLDDALVRFRDVLSASKTLNPEEAARLLLGECRLREARELAHVGDFEGATATLKSAIQLRPEITNEPQREVANWVTAAQVRRAKQLAATNKLPEAITLLRRAVALDNNNESAYLELASVLSSAGDHGGAVSAMRNALHLVPTTANTIELADYLRLNKEYPEAQTLLKRAIEANPSDERAHRILGLLSLAADDPRSALKEFTNALSIKPTTYAYEEIARIYESKQDFDHALDNLRKAEALDPNDVSAHRKSSRIYLEELGDFDSAYRELSAARDLAPDDAGLQADYVEVCITTGRFKETIDGANELLESPALLQDLSVSDQLAVRFMKLTALLLEGRMGDANLAHEDLIKYAAGLPTFNHSWSYAGTRRFLEGYRMDENKRTHLLQLLGMLDKMGKHTQKN